MNTYKWTIKQLDYVVEQNGKSNVVTNIHWGVVATSDQIARSIEVDGQTISTPYQALTYGVCPIKLKEDTSFIEYESLNKDQVLIWLMAELGDVQIDAIQKSLDAQIEDLINPPIKSGIPWGQ